MDIEGSISKLLTPIEKHGALAGAGLAGLYIYKAGSWGSTLDGLLSAQVHMPDLKEFMDELFRDRSFLAAAALGVGGYFLKDATNSPTLSKIAGIAEKGGLGFAAVVAAYFVLYSMTHSDAPSGNASPTGNRGYGY